jgi:hypothetical protein
MMVCGRFYSLRVKNGSASLSRVDERLVEMQNG